MQKTYYKSLIGLRGIFILMVVLFHIQVTLDNALPNMLEFVYTYGGYMGNYFFFMLSGFLIAHSYKNSIISSGIDLLSFLKKRLVKLYPLYITSNALALLIKIHFNGWSGSVRLSDLIKVTFLTTTGWIDDGYPYNEPCWFVSVLFLCYIIVYFVFKLSQQHKDLYFLLLLLLPLWGYYLENAWLAVPFCYNHNGEGFLNFFIGVSLYEIISACEKNVKKIKIVAIIISMFLLLLCFRFGFEIICDDPRLLFTFVICPFSIFFAICEKTCNSILCLKPFQWIGKISISIFFFHSPLLTIFALNKVHFESQSWYNSQLYVTIYFILLFLISTGTYFLLEQKIAKKNKNC